MLIAMAMGMYLVNEYEIEKVQCSEIIARTL